MGLKFLDMVSQARSLSLSKKRLPFSIADSTACSTPICPKKLYSANKGALATGHGTFEMTSEASFEQTWTNKTRQTRWPDGLFATKEHGVPKYHHTHGLINASWNQLSNPWVTQQRLRSPPRFCSSQTAQTGCGQRTGQAAFSVGTHATCRQKKREGLGDVFKGLNKTLTRPKIASTSWTYSNSTRNSGLRLGPVMFMWNSELLELRDIFTCIRASLQSQNKIQRDMPMLTRSYKLVIPPDSSTMLYQLSKDQNSECNESVQWGRTNKIKQV